jgi:hypothetical protein
MLTIQQREELLHYAYITAIASKAGVNLRLGEFVYDLGIDGEFKKVIETETKDNKRELREGAGTLDFQLKATKNATFNEKRKKVSFRIHRNHYNKLVEYEKPIMLILLVLPKDESQWVELSDDCLILRKCCYWTYLFNKKRKPDNTSSIKIEIPVENVLTSEQICIELDKFDEVEKSNKSKYKKIAGY